MQHPESSSNDSHNLKRKIIVTKRARESDLQISQRIGKGKGKEKEKEENDRDRKRRKDSSNHGSSSASSTKKTLEEIERELWADEQVGKPSSGPSSQRMDKARVKNASRSTSTTSTAATTPSSSSSISSNDGRRARRSLPNPTRQVSTPLSSSKLTPGSSERKTSLVKPSLKSSLLKSVPTSASKSTSTSSPIEKRNLGNLRKDSSISTSSSAKNFNSPNASKKPSSSKAETSESDSQDSDSDDSDGIMEVYIPIYNDPPKKKKVKSSVPTPIKSEIVRETPEAETQEAEEETRADQPPSNLNKEVEVEMEMETETEENRGIEKENLSSPKSASIDDGTVEAPGTDQEMEQVDQNTRGEEKEEEEMEIETEQEQTEQSEIQPGGIQQDEIQQEEMGHEKDETDRIDLVDVKKEESEDEMEIEKETEIGKVNDQEEIALQSETRVDYAALPSDLDREASKQVLEEAQLRPTTSNEKASSRASTSTVIPVELQKAGEAVPFPSFANANEETAREGENSSKASEAESDQNKPSNRVQPQAPDQQSKTDYQRQQWALLTDAQRVQFTLFEISKLRASHVSVQTERDQARSEVKRLEMELQKQSDSTQRSNTSFSEALYKQEVELKFGESKIAEVNKRLAETDAKLEEKKDQLREHHHQFQVALGKAKVDNQNLNRYFESIKQHKTNLQQEVTALENGKEILMREVRQLETERNRFFAFIGDVKSFNEKAVQAHKLLGPASPWNQQQQQGSNPNQQQQSRSPSFQGFPSQFQNPQVVPQHRLHPQSSNQTKQQSAQNHRGSSGNQHPNHVQQRPVGPSPQLQQDLNLFQQFPPSNLSGNMGMGMSFNMNPPLPSPQEPSVQLSHPVRSGQETSFGQVRPGVVPQQLQRPPPPPNTSSTNAFVTGVAKASIDQLNSARGSPTTSTFYSSLLTPSQAPVSIRHAPSTQPRTGNATASVSPPPPIISRPEASVESASRISGEKRKRIEKDQDVLSSNLKEPQLLFQNTTETVGQSSKTTTEEVADEDYTSDSDRSLA